MVHNHREAQPPPRGRGGRPSTRATALRRPGLRSGGPPPEPTTDTRAPRMTIRIPARANNGETGPTTSSAVEGDIQEVAPPVYTERVEPESIAIPKSDDESSHVEPGQQTGDTRVGPTTEGVQDGGSERRDSSQEAMATAPSVSQPGAGENPGVIPQGGPRIVQVQLDTEIAETIRRIAQEQQDGRREQRELWGEVENVRQEQRELRGEVESVRHERRQLQTGVESSCRETFEVRVLVKTHESRLNQIFERIGNVIDDQWGLRAGIGGLQSPDHR